MQVCNKSTLDPPASLLPVTVGNTDGWALDGRQIPDTRVPPAALLTTGREKPPLSAHSCAIEATLKHQLSGFRLTVLLPRRPESRAVSRSFDRMALNGTPSNIQTSTPCVDVRLRDWKINAHCVKQTKQQQQLKVRNRKVYQLCLSIKLLCLQMTHADQRLTWTLPSLKPTCREEMAHPGLQETKANSKSHGGLALGCLWHVSDMLLY